MNAIDRGASAIASGSCLCRVSLWQAVSASLSKLEQALAAQLGWLGEHLGPGQLHQKRVCLEL